MIQKFLNERLIKTTDDTNVDKLKKACSEVVKKISKDKAKISSYTLVALDPQVQPDNSHILEVKQIIIDHWPTFLANSNDIPVTFIRAVMLDALETVSKESRIASLIWFSGRNAIKYYKLGGEKELLTNFILELGNRIETEVTETWSFSPDDEIEIPEIAVATIDKGEVEVILKAAAIHQPWGEGGENPTAPSAGNAEWGKFFASKASKGLTDIVNKSLKKQAKEILINQGDFIYANNLFQMRTKLLWWKEACYSSSLKGSYKELKTGMLEVIMAHDYSSLVPVMYPNSVDYFLKETHNGLRTTVEKKVPVSEILKLIEEDKTNLKPILTENAGEEKRISFINFINGLVHEKYKVSQFKDIVGVDESTELTFAELTIWLFHDLHVIKISTED